MLPSAAATVPHVPEATEAKRSLVASEAALAAKGPGGKKAKPKLKKKAKRGQAEPTLEEVAKQAAKEKIAAARAKKAEQDAARRRRKKKAPVQFETWSPLEGAYGEELEVWPSIDTLCL